jgi:hypothetical protein
MMQTSVLSLKKGYWTNQKPLVKWALSLGIDDDHDDDDDDDDDEGSPCLQQ